MEIYTHFLKNCKESNLVCILRMMTPNQKLCLMLVVSLAQVTQKHLVELNSEDYIFTVN